MVKKFLSAVMVVLMLFSLSACSNVKPGEFTVTVEYINEKLDKADLPVYVEKLDKYAGGGTIETEVHYIISIKDKNEPEKTVGLLSLNYKNGFCDEFSVSSGLQYKGLQNTKKFIRFACDLYGVNSKVIINKLKDNFESGKNIEHTNLSAVKTGFFENGFHYEFSFITETEGDYSLENLTLVSMMITEENKYNAAQERSRQALLKLIDDNPLLYTYGEPDWQQWKNNDEINRILKGLNTPYTSEFNYFSKTEIGTANTAYIIFDSKGEKAGDIAPVRFASGYEYSVFQNTVDGNGWIIRISAEDILKTACEISGAEYTNELLNNVNDYMTDNIYSAYFEYDGLYFTPMFSTMYGNYKYLHGISVYEPDVFKGRLISWISNSKDIGMDYTKYQEIYDKYFE